jgi:hypothetical protein
MFQFHTQTTKVDVAEFARLKQFFMILELMAHAPEDFHVDDHFNLEDDVYSMLIQFQEEASFDFQGFIELAIKNIGTGFSRVINGYEELVERFCDPQSLVIEQKPDTVMVNAKFFGEYNSFSEYIDAVTGAGTPGHKYLVFDPRGNEVEQGDFFKKSTYPINVFRRIRKEAENQEQKIDYKSEKHN